MTVVVYPLRVSSLLEKDPWSKGAKTELLILSDHFLSLFCKRQS